MDTSSIVKANKHCELRKDEDFKFVTLGSQNFDEVVDLLKKYFVLFESINIGLGANFEHKKEFIESNVRQYLNSGVSIGAQNNEGRLIGVSLHTIERRNKMTEKGADLAIPVEINIMVRNTL
ncbi:unnamed protein product [Meganyctiphanes norvegica]|uniref:Uncharacterized protein n=1 Tax=Meganyctiphanes norvegica TaxID=48144 RepID=A0AAV2RT48_MEGNR